MTLNVIPIFGQPVDPPDRALRLSALVLLYELCISFPAAAFQD